MRTRVCSYFASVVMIASLLSACTADGEARFEGTLSDECYAAQLPFEPDYFALVETRNGAFMRMELHPQARTQVDGLYIVLDDAFDGASIVDPQTGATQTLSCPDKASIQAGGTFTVGSSQCARAYLSFNESCQRVSLNAQIEGQLTLDTFGFEEDDRVSGSLQGEVFNVQEYGVPGGPTTSSVSLGDLSGTFDFTVVIDQSHLRFTTPPEHILRP